METGSVQIGFDIETVMNERAPQWWDTVKIEAPKNFKDPEKIKAAIDEKKAKLYSKSALTWHTGKVFSFAAVSVKNPKETKFFHSLDEKEVLNEIAKACNGKEVFAKHGKHYDYPFLVGRYLANSIAVPSFLRGKQMAREVNDFWSYSQSCDQILNLEATAYGLGIEGKFGDFKIVGQVYDSLITNTCTPEMLKQLEDYNIQDAAIVAEIVRRYNGYL